MENRWQRLQQRLHRNRVTGALTKVVVTVVGVAVLLAGVVMMVAPGPGVVGILVGLAILATEWHWARRLLGWARERFQAATARAREMDPAVRRRRILGALVATVVVVGGIALYVALADWPGWSVSAWDWVQGLVGFVPDLPGM